MATVKMYRSPNVGGRGGGVLSLRSNSAGVYDGKIAGLYDLEETLGRGHFAVVKLARHVFTGEKVAVKVIDKSKLDDVSKAHLFQEVRCMKLVQHPNVVRLYEVIDTATKLYLILELGDGGDLYDYIMRHESGLSEQLAKDYFRQIVRAISYCHRLHVVHRDLKPENVVFFENLGVVKLTDFGFSNKFCPGQKLETSCGSLAYSAPEILLGDSYDAPAVDVWSLGVILYMLVCGHAPFQEANDSETLTMIMDCKYSVPLHISTECKDLISRMLIRDPEKRATLTEIAKHPWLKQKKEDHIDILPLVSREQLCDEDHNFIVQKIVNGNIATKEEIQESLDKNAYNHITATYYLLAERKLRSKRQEQVSINKKRPENLSVSQNVNRSNGNSVGTPCLLAVPRTPGDLPQRSRKCSIVQEDEEEEDLSGREDSQTHGSLNRRGSRSEGRLNLTVQGCLNEKEFKNEEKKREIHKPVVKQFSHSITNNQQKTVISQHSPSKWHKSNSVPQPIPHKPKKIPDVVSTSILNESSTISIPVLTNSPYPPQKFAPNFKTMPSPTRTSPVIPSPLQLNEIFEEGDGIDSNLHHSSRNIVSRNQKRVSYEHRRSKFHKSRTASCSSSDASDDDSENRKKRAHKFNSTKEEPLKGRRDSHDDSSDSQEPGTGTSTGGSSSIKPPIITQTTQNTSTKTRNTSNNNNNSNNNSGRKNANNLTEANLMKKHKIIKRRNGETRLRESQSLNRITEVQEEIQSVVLTTTITTTQGVTSSSKARSLGARIWHGLTTGAIKTNMEEKHIGDNKQLRRAAKPTVELKEDAKKKTLIGKYLQVQRKLSLPLPAFLNKSRLYKAQSCSSIVHAKTLPGDTNKMQRAKSVVRNIELNKFVTLNEVCNEITGICKEHFGQASKCCSFC
ncbi:MAP/microtubule affinity-regulating kinase 3 isoform X2 [Agrilus planipennis]|uniref:SNF-related serine/threonine-protein kinase n=1 Tax=Agrilus planipennis TaxID=224129 RepID=A0A1W4WZJ1_AGRPL|nr:MAP/microtubule affinity-regulating kinase 3 isoform X2 [Agrilus planipennis]